MLQRMLKRMVKGVLHRVESCGLCPFWAAFAVSAPLFALAPDFSYGQEEPRLPAEYRAQREPTGRSIANPAPLVMRSKMSSDRNEKRT
jgi:hypothetical protein